MSKLLEERVVAYTDLLTDDIKQTVKMTDDLRELAQTKVAERIHPLLQALSKGPLTNEWVKVPRQYSSADMYMIALDRLMSFAGLNSYEIFTPEDREELTLIPAEINLPAAFQFVVANQQNVDGAYFVEVNSGLRLFYWQPSAKRLLFNADALTDLLVARYRKQTTAAKIRVFTELLTQFARYLEREFSYTVDYNILETQDTFLYPLVQLDMPAGMLDRLFILSAESNFFLQGIKDGAGMVLDNNVEIRIFYVPDPTVAGGQRWQFQVVDGKDAVSWLDVLLDYDFIGAWYLVERQYIAIKSDGLIFGNQTASLIPDPLTPSRPEVEVQILQPRGIKEG